MVVEIGLDALGDSKILFGSDAAEGFDVGRPPARPRPARSYAKIIEEYRARGISDATLERVLYENAKALFDLSV
jgi:predicted TIM-barrel fold metal-dependent hydrolase